jgi:Tfp pilus assembly protein PilV
MKISRKRHFQRGDTIVEVLIAIAVVTSVLAGAFAVSQKSALAVRNSQEKSEMLHLLNGQVEMVRAAATISDENAGIFNGGYFCMNPTSGLRENAGGSVNVDNPSTFAASCKNLTSDGTQTSTGLYNMVINYDTSSETFTAYGRWDSLNGQQGSMQLSYRVYPGK